MTTKHTVLTEFTMSELHEDKRIKWHMHIAKDLSPYNIIIRQDLLEFLGIDICFSIRPWYGIMPQCLSKMSLISLRVLTLFKKIKQLQKQLIKPKKYWMKISACKSGIDL